ncbi:Protein mak11 [Lithohypha guttulata]|uniref:Protein mak11 n=1 Tax=Lithohypha guttulata TaxID=1690604 RepID=A0AAN7Y9U1_9EURO|nr:Protein mak11 [Lithohypha guttulata]
MSKRKRDREADKAPNVVNDGASQPLKATAKLQSQNQGVSSSSIKPQPSKSSANNANGGLKTSNASIQQPKSAATPKSTKIPRTENHIDVKTELPVVQIITGSYERTLHGITAKLSLNDGKLRSIYADSFLFNAHQSAVRCLALSPMPEESDQGVYLATGGSDERVNIYSLSAAPVPDTDRKGRKVPTMPTFGPNQISENPLNRELGTLVQHSSSITALHFPSRSKLLSASEDNTISVTRVRDLEVISTVKAPRPKVSGQASGDSASAGTVPSGVNDFAIHPSMKLMVSVGRGEKCMRLWNLVTGKKAGVLNFERDILQAVKEGKYSHGEGRKIRWNHSGTEFSVAFERGVVVFGQDSKPRCVLMPSTLTKVHQLVYFRTGKDHEFLACSTDDGKILFFDTAKASTATKDLPLLNPIAYMGGEKHAITKRIKDFQILDLTKHGFPGRLTIVGCSNGDISLLSLRDDEILKPETDGGFVGTASADVYSTGNRVTCLVAFAMLPALDIEGGLSEAESGLGSEIDTEDSSDNE